MLLRSGISYRQFDEIVKRAFVAQSITESSWPRKRTNTSRVAVRTGMSRKEVARIRDFIEKMKSGAPVNPEPVFHSSQAARLLQVWHTDPACLDKSGRPLGLSFDSGTPSFASMVRSVGGDVPAGAVRAELLSAGAIEELPDGRLMALKRYFIPGDLGEDMVVGFTHIVTPLLSALDHNTQAPKSEAFIQRVSYSDNLGPDAVPQFRRLASDRAAEFVNAVDEWLSANEDTKPDFDRPEQRVGVGVFYFEQERPELPVQK
jgi:hypothetical protein